MVSCKKLIPINSIVVITTQLIMRNIQIKLIYLHRKVSLITRNNKEINKKIVKISEIINDNDKNMNKKIACINELIRDNNKFLNKKIISINEIVFPH